MSVKFLVKYTIFTWPYLIKFHENVYYWSYMEFYACEYGSDIQGRLYIGHPQARRLSAETANVGNTSSPPSLWQHQSILWLTFIKYWELYTQSDSDVYKQNLYILYKPVFKLDSYLKLVKATYLFYCDFSCNSFKTSVYHFTALPKT